MTTDEVQAIVRGIAPVVREIIERKGDDISARIAALEARIAALEEREREKSGALKIVKGG